MRRIAAPFALVVFVLAGCATSAALTPARVERVPPGEYRVRVVEDRSGSRAYQAVLFVRETASVTLDTPTVDRGMTSSPSDYQMNMRTDFVVYELKSGAGPTQAYLLASSRAMVRVWVEPGGQGVLHVTLRDASGEPEMGGGGGAGGGSM